MEEDERCLKMLYSKEVSWFCVVASCLTPKCSGQFQREMVVNIEC